MMSTTRTFTVTVIAAVFAFALAGVAALGVTAPGSAFADVGSIAAGEDITYDKDGGVLSSMGFDTSKMPDDYDPDATTNPYGSDVSTLDEVKEAFFFDLSYHGGVDVGNQPRAFLYGHNKKLNGSYDEFVSDPIKQDLDGRYVSDQYDPREFIGKGSFIDAAKCDITGDGRDSALAIVYTNYYNSSDPDPNIYLCLYDSVTGRHSEPVVVGEFTSNDSPEWNKPRVTYGYLIQSQIQITVGDFDKDSIDEIAVYSPAKSDTDRNTIKFFDLIEGKDCKDPFNKDAWQHSWNYMLPRYSEEIIDVSKGMQTFVFTTNLYNNIDLTSGDADNDGIDDLIISYGASDTGYHDNGFRGSEQDVVRSIPSKSVLLYGSDDGQMLRDSQSISYGGQELIRVSFAFGDVDADGNEDMFIAGQLQSEQRENVSRVLGRYVYDTDAGEMALESMQDMKVVSGTWGDTDDDGVDDTFYSSNGWDGSYYSVPMMKTNLAIGKILGDNNSTKIYLDSVLYSYDNGNYEIVDELEDDSEDGDGKYKGSRLFAGEKAMMGYYNDPDVPSCYYEIGVDTGNFTGSVTDYFLVNRVSIDQNRPTGFGGVKTEATSSILFSDSEGNLMRKDPIHGDSEYKGISADRSVGTPVLAVAVDTDKDGLVAEYTGQHDIQYQDPAVLAVLASPPYFKDVAAYDENEMLVYLATEYGSTSGKEHGHEETYEGTIGAFLNTQHGLSRAHGILNVGAGYARSETWGWEKERTFTMSYSTIGGEDAVVMYSVPSENYLYKVHGVTVDDDGNCEQFTNTMIVTKPHKPVTQTLILEDYMEIQERYSDVLPDVTKYLTSTPGDPSTYPTSKKDLSDEALSHIDYDTDHPIDAGEKWAGVTFGNGSVTQTLSYSKSTRDRYKNHMDGGYGSVEVGFGSDHDDYVWFMSLEVGLAYEFSQMHGYTNATLSGSDCAGTITNMPRDAKGYGYGFSWKLLKYNIEDKGCTFPVVTYIVNDLSAPPELPETIEQDFEKSTDSQIVLNWTYNNGSPLGFDIYRYKDFPVGGGDELIATVAGTDFKIMKDDDGNTLRDKNGRIIRGYSFTDTDLTADTKYQYRMKVRTAKQPGESIFSPVIEARTDVGTKPALSLSTDELTIYPDGAYNIKVNLADPENYQSDMSYQWQKFDSKKRKWEDIEGCDKQALHFFNSKTDDAGTYRCRVNLIRKVESHPQYISAFTDSCTVGFSLRSVKFGPITVFDGKGLSKTNTGLYVNLTNTSQSSLEKPTGIVVFNITGPNGTFQVAGNVDEQTGDVRINSIEDLVEDLGQSAFVDGGYVIAVRYSGSAIFNPSKDAEEFHYLRNIDESVFLSLKSSYYFGEDIVKTMGLYDYKLGPGGVKRTDLTGRVSKIKFYQVAEDGLSKTGDAVGEFDVSGGIANIPVPLNKNLAKKAYVEAYVDGSSEPAGATVIQTRKVPIELAVQDKVTGVGDVLQLPSGEDVKLSNGADPFEDNIETESGNKSLADFMVFKYFEQNGDLICDSTQVDEHAGEFVPASYYATVTLKSGETYIGPDDAEHAMTDPSYFYAPTFKRGKFLVVASYYLVSAGPKDANTGRVRMISPDDRTDFADEGYVGGTTLVLKAEPNPGYKVDKWIVDDCGTKTTYSGVEKFTYVVRSQAVEGGGKVSIVAQMTPKDNRIKIGTVGSGQVATVPQIASGDNVLTGTKLAFTAIPDSGWHFAEWRWTTLGGSNTVSSGTANDDGSNTKVFTMPDSSAEVYALFARDTVDVVASDGLDVLFTNDGGDPYHEVGETVQTERGRNVPKGSVVTVRTKSGFVLPDNAEWTVTVANEQGEVPVEVTEAMSQGKRACTFELPDDAVSCAVTAATAKGKYTVTAETAGVQFTISVDGRESEEPTVEGITSGSQVDIKAKAQRGKRITGWIVNGETQKTDDAIYTCNIKENMSIAVTTEPTDEYSMALAAEGGGTLKYAISDAEGDELVVGAVGEDGADPVPVYPGESVSFQASNEDGEYTLTSISLNGVNQDLDEGVFTVTSVEGDIDVVATFSPNAYFDASFSTSFRSEGALLLDGNDDVIDNGETLRVPKNREFPFSLVLQKERVYFVWVNGQAVEPLETEAFDSERNRYRFKTEKVISSLEITAQDHETLSISDGGDLQNYLDVLAATSATDKPYDQPDCVLQADVDMAGMTVEPIDDMYARFDGNGYTIKNLTVGSEDSRITGFHGLFGTIHPEAELKNIVFDGISVYANSSPEGDGLLSHLNYGTISGVTIVNSYFDINHSGYSLNHELTAGLAYENLGTIEYCMVSNLTIASDLNERMSGSAGVVYNKFEHADSEAEASMTGNYFEYLYRGGYNTEDGPVLGTRDIIAWDQHEGFANYGSFTANYFLSKYDSMDNNGVNAFNLTESPDDRESSEAEVLTAEFSRKLAHTMNSDIGKKVWGVTGNSDDDTGVYQLNRKDGDYIAPVKVDFVSGKKVTRYYVPGEVVLPGQDEFGITTPVAWEIGDKAYLPGATVDIQSDMRIIGVADFSEFAASVSEVADDGTVLGAVYYEDVNDAMRDIAQVGGQTSRELHIIGEAVLSGTAQGVGDKAKIVVEDGASLTIGKDLQVNNKGTIVVEPGATVHKYGSLLNEGLLSIDAASDFCNYGSALVDKGIVVGKEYVKCKPHLYGKWTYADEPNEDGSWSWTGACSVCGIEKSGAVAPNPVASEVDSIEVVRKPATTSFKLGDQFTDEGLSVIAHLADGGKATINEYKLVLQIGNAEGKAIANGDVLSDAGSGKVTVKYGAFGDSYGVEVRNSSGGSGGGGGGSGGGGDSSGGDSDEPVDNVKPGITEDQVDEYLDSLESDDDPAGSGYSILRLVAKKTTSTSITLKWAKVKGAEKYLVYGNERDGKKDYEKIKTLTKNKLTVKKIDGKKLEKGTYYKFIAVAIDKNDKVISTSKVVSVATKGSKFTNPVKVKAKSSVSVGVGKTKKVKAKQVNPKKGKVKKCSKIRYESTNTKVATVNKSGKVKGVGKGKCTIYAFAQNGVAKKIKVKVKGKGKTKLKVASAG